MTTSRPPFFLAALGLVILLASESSAQNSGGEALHILRPVLHAEQDKAELCLEFDHPLSDSGGLRNSGNLRLETAGKRINLTRDALNVSSSSLCIAGLEHRKNYRLSLTDIKGDKGEKLTDPYHLSFTVPDRKASLAFLSDLFSDGLMRWQGAEPILRGMNVQKAKIELYRIDTLPLMAEAWRQHRQTTLAPSESAYFARTKGKLVWQGYQELGDTANKPLDKPLQLQSEIKDVAAGFYLVIASATSTTNSASKNEFVPLAAAWLLRSDLKIKSLQDASTLYALAEKADASDSYKNIHFTLLNSNQDKIAEADSDASGVAVFALSDDKRKNATTLVGQSSTGAIDMIALQDQPKDQPPTEALTSPNLTATLATDSDFYAPESLALIMPQATDANGKTAVINETFLNILRPDHSLYARMPLANGINASNPFSLHVPLGNGAWTLQWQKKSGETLAETILRITDNPRAPTAHMDTDRTVLGRDGNLNLRVHTTRADGKAEPFVSGDITVNWGATDSLFPGWDGYHFGGTDKAKSENLQTLSFLTDSSGQVTVPLHLDVPNNNAILRAAIITVHTDVAAGVLDPAPVLVPVSPADSIVGIRPLAQDGRFAENSLARFDIVALNSEGRQRAFSNARFQIIEEGRRFDWFQDTGHWNYKLLEQSRRIGGGALTLSADTPTRIDWNVAAGSYRLDILDSNGTLMASLPFTAGWTSNLRESTPATSLPLVGKKSADPSRTEYVVSFTLDEPALITAVIADQTIRKVVFEQRSAGLNSLTITPAANWGQNLTITVEAEHKDNDGTLRQHKGRMTLTGQDKPKTTAPVDTKKSAVSQANNPSPSKASLPAALTGFDQDLQALPQQIITPRQIWSSPTANPANGKKRAATVASGFAMASPYALGDLPRLLSLALRTESVTTVEIASMIECLQLWRRVLVQGNIVSDSDLANRLRAQKRRLLMRQLPDGSWPKQTTSLKNTSGDLSATSAALSALVSVSDDKDEAVKHAMNQASEWLRRRLDNSWFDEAERIERAPTYVALARAGRSDNATLHYYADTSVGKDLPAVTAAQIALAFAINRDQDKAIFWLNAINAPRQGRDIPSQILPLLADNYFFDEHNLFEALESKSHEKRQTLADLHAVLRATGLAHNRGASWRINVNGTEQSLRGIAIKPMNSNSVVTLKNPTDRTLYVTPVQINNMTARRDYSMQRHFFRMDGSELTDADSLLRGAYYVMMIEGSMGEEAGDNNLFVLHVPTTPALTTVSCALNPTVKIEENLHWLETLSLTPNVGCERLESGIQTLINASSVGKDIWRIAVIVQAAQKGRATLGPVAKRLINVQPESRDEGSLSDLDTRYSNETRIQIQ